MPDRNARIWTGSDWELISSPVAASNAVAVWQSSAPSSPVTGQIWIDSDDNKMYVWSGSAWNSVSLDLSLYATLASPIFTGTVVLPTSTSIGSVSSTEIGYLDGVTSAIQTQLDAKASLSSPSFSGTPTAPTAAVLTNTTQIATTAFVNAEISNDAVLNSGGSTITVSSGTTVPLTIQNNGTGNSLVINDEASDTTPFVIDAIGEVGIGTSSPQAFLDVKNGTTYSSTGNFLTRIQQNTNSPGANGLSVMNAWASTGSTIFEVAMGWNGSAAGYYPTFSVDGVGNVTLSNVTSAALRMKLPTNMTLEAPVVTNVQGGSYTLALTDAGRLIEMSSGSAATLTVPADGTVNFPIGTKIDILRTGGGEISIAGATSPSTVTVNSDGSKLRINAQWAAATLIKRAANTWVLIGALKT